MAPAWQARESRAMGRHSFLSPNSGFVSGNVAIWGFGKASPDSGQNSVARMASPHPPGSRTTPVAVPPGAACA